MADIEVGFVNVCEKFGIRALNDYQREPITLFVNNTGIGQDRVIDFLKRLRLVYYETMGKGISYSVEQTLVGGNKSPQDVCEGD